MAVFLHIRLHGWVCVIIRKFYHCNLNHICSLYFHHQAHAKGANTKNQCGAIRRLSFESPITTEHYTKTETYSLWSSFQLKTTSDHKMEPTTWRSSWSFLLIWGCCGFADCFNAFYLKLEYIMAYIQSVLLSKWSLWRKFTSKLHIILGTATLTMGIFRSTKQWRQWIGSFENTNNTFWANVGIKDIHRFSVFYIGFM